MFLFRACYRSAEFKDPGISGRKYLCRRLWPSLKAFSVRPPPGVGQVVVLLHSVLLACAVLCRRVLFAFAELRESYIMSCGLSWRFSVDDCENSAFEILAGVAGESSIRSQPFYVAVVGYSFSRNQPVFFE